MVAVINFGGQYAHLIARRVRELGVKSELVNPEIKIEDLKKLSPTAIIFSGSPFSVYEKNAPHPDTKIYGLNIPILGICYGHQLIAHQLNGKVSPGKTKQFGKESLEIGKSPLFKGLSKKEIVWFSHGDQVNTLPAGFECIASTKSAKLAGQQNLSRKIFGIQFHPEVTHTQKGTTVLKNFLFDISKVKKDWDLGQVKDSIIKEIRQKVGRQNSIMAVSGGVDSLVAATLIKIAAPNNLHLIFIDTGLMRKNEVEEVKKIINCGGFKNFTTINASKIFLKALSDIVDPEEKRKVIAREYFKVFENEAEKIKDASPAGRQVKFLGQGTIYPDRIESAQPNKHADKIKSHHNVTLPDSLKLKLIEPLADLYKDEVRKIGLLLKIPQKFIQRHPFPGPALAIRILGEVTEERLAILREVDDIFISELKSSGLYNKVGQAFAALLPIKSVGVMGDARTYSYIVSLRSVDTTDFMTADWTKFPPAFLEKVSSRIVNEVRGVNRVLYDITQKPPATIEYE
ncbi:MAG: glutamine-hydrolyzing GMP synthase [Patescibacteria group bacterium]